MLQQLNGSFKSFLIDPFDLEAWADFDLAFIRLIKEGYLIQENNREGFYSTTYKQFKFDLKEQLEFIYAEKKRALDLQFFDYLNQILAYKQVLCVCGDENLPAINVYEDDYFVESEGKVIYHLSNHPLINLKITTIINRRCKKA